jgi:hypothetical protein
MCSIPNVFRDRAILLCYSLDVRQEELRRATILELYSEITLISETVRNRTHIYIYIYNFLLRMTDTMTSHNIGLPSWDIL